MQPKSGFHNALQSWAKEIGFAAPSGTQRLPAWLPGLVLVAATLLVYVPVWHAGFIWDDGGFLLHNSSIRASDGLYRFWFTTQSPDYFPMTSSSLWMEWRLWGEDPLGYHITNVLLHAVSSVLLWRILLALKIPGAWLAAAVFALHPVNVESVAWITERKNTLAMFFYAWAMLWYLRFDDSGRRTWYWLSAAAFALALLSKTAVVAAPVVLLGIVWWRRRSIGRRDLARVLPFFGIAGLLGLITVWFQYHRAIAGAVVREDHFWGRLAGAGMAVWFYLYKVFWPVNLIFVYPRWKINPTNLLSYVPGLLLAALLAACWFGRRGWGRPVLFGLGYFVVMLLPVLGFLDIYFMRFSLVADHWQYFAVIGPIALAAGAFTVAAGTSGGGRLAGLLLSVGLLATLGALTWRHSRLFSDSMTLWSATVERNPRATVGEYNLGCLFLSAGRPKEAQTHFEKALLVEPGFADAHNNLGNLLLLQGEVEKAIAQFRAALNARPRFADARSNLGGALLQQGRAADAIGEFQQALEINPEDPLTRYNLGCALLKLRRPDEAIAQFQQALDLQPEFAEARFKLASALLQKGRNDEAISQLQLAAQLNPKLAKVRSDLGTLLLQKGQAPEAIAQYQAAIALQPDNMFFLNNLAWMLATYPDPQFRNGAQAVELALKAKHFGGAGNPEILGTLASAYAEDGKFQEALRSAEEALKLANASSNTSLAASLTADVALFRAGLPLRDTSVTNISPGIRDH